MANGYVAPDCPACGHADGQHDEAGCLWPQWADTPGVPTCSCSHGSPTGPEGAPAACRYCETAYTTCVDDDPCCKACLHADGHASHSAPSAVTE